MIRGVGIWDLVLKDRDTMRVLQHNHQLALLSIIQVIHACSTPLVLHATIVIGISKVVDRIILQDRVDRMITITDLAIMDLAHRIVDRDQMVTITDLQVARMPTMPPRMQPIAEQWEWQMDQLTLIHLKMY